MSSATSTDDLRQVQGKTSEVGANDASAFQPWQFFLLAGMLAATATVIVATGQSPASIVVLSLTVIAASLVGFAVYRSLLPLVLPHTVHAPTLIGGRTRAALEREKTLVLRSIKELEFDRAMGKVAQADFEDMSNRLRTRALGLMRQLDSAGGYRDEIERELRTRLAGNAGLKARATSPAAEATPMASDVPRDFLTGEASASFDRRRTPPSDVEAAPALSPAIADPSSATGAAPPISAICASCGTSNDFDAKFCKNCGTRLTRAALEAS